jgi:hypothetical protein
VPVPSRRLKDLIEGTADHHASRQRPALEEVTITWRGSDGYLTGYLSDDDDDDDQIKLCRIEYLGLGPGDDWAFAIWQASTDNCRVRRARRPGIRGPMQPWLAQGRR